MADSFFHAVRAYGHATSLAAAQTAAAAGIAANRAVRQTAPAPGFIAAPTVAGAVVAVVVITVFAEERAVGIRNGPAVVTGPSIPVLNSHKWGMGVVGGEDGPDHHQNVVDAAIPQGVGDGHRGIPGAEPFIPYVGMGDGLVAGGRIGRQCHHLEPASRVVDVELGQFDLDPERSQMKPFENHGISNHGEHTGLSVQAASVELIEELAEFLMDQAKGGQIGCHFPHRPFAVAQGVLQVAEGDANLPTDLVSGMGPHPPSADLDSQPRQGHEQKQGQRQRDTAKDRNLAGQFVALSLGAKSIDVAQSTRLPGLVAGPLGGHNGLIRPLPGHVNRFLGRWIGRLATTWARRDRHHEDDNHDAESAHE
ncbi:hypothetical protein B7486_25805 [cyanobacterium TDX16]|nr:hypothetical protein B7486_25805 [cyanobacterium TDX16]